MATKSRYNNSSNPFDVLQQESAAPVAQAKRQPKAGDADFVPVTPAEKAKARAAQQAVKAAELEARKKQEAAEAALAAQAGPLEGFVTQKGSQPRKTKEEQPKKVNRETFEKTGGQVAQNTEKRQFQGEKKPYNKDGKPRQFDDKRPFDEKKQFKGERKPRPEGEGQRPPKREFDKHSAGKTSNKFEEKRGGRGQANWGAAVDNKAAEPWGDAPAETPAAETAGWGDEGEVKAPAAEAPGWGDEGEAKTAPADAAEEVAKEEKEKVARGPAWDEVEGFGKLTLAEYEKLKAQKDAELEAKVGVKEKRVVEVDTSKFVLAEKSVADEKGLPAKKEAKKGQQRAGTKAVDLAEVFAVRGGGAGRGGRGGFQGDRQQGQRGGRGGNRVPGAKQFPDLVPQTAKNAKA